ncbi:MAG: tetratricopeptide repeat protein [Azoarcus sp.]|jgi:tetratricopeptide (TPR) repeat protein|nr:tetratricopeptide repeat protein [Azoarcus sp.]
MKTLHSFILCLLMLGLCFVGETARACAVAIVGTDNEPIQDEESLKSIEKKINDKEIEDIAALDDIDKRFGKSGNTELRRLAVIALGLKGSLVSGTCHTRIDDAVNIWNEADERYGDDPDPAIRAEIAQILLKKLESLVAYYSEIPHAGLGKYSNAAFATFNALVKRYGEDKDPIIRRKVAISFMQKSRLLSVYPRSIEEDFTENNASPMEREALRKAEEMAARDVLDELVRRYGNDEDPEVSTTVSDAMYTKGQLFYSVGDVDEEMAAYDELGRHYGKNETLAVRLNVIKGFDTKAWRLFQKADSSTEKNYIPVFAVLDDIIGRFGDDARLDVQVKLADISIKRANILSRMEMPEKELIPIYDDIIQKYKKSESPEMRAQVAAALANKAEFLAGKAKINDALDLCDRVDEIYGKDNAPIVRLQVANTLNIKGELLIKQNKPKKALVVFNEVIRRYKKKGHYYGDIEIGMFAAVLEAERYRNKLSGK